MTTGVAKGKSPFHADRGHLHHKLMDIGWGKRRIAVFYWGITAVLGLIALSLSNTQEKLVMFGIVVVLFVGFLASVQFSNLFNLQK